MLIATALFIVHFLLIMRCFSCLLFHNDFHNPSKFKQYTYIYVYCISYIQFLFFNYFGWIQLPVFLFSSLFLYFSELLFFTGFELFVSIPYLDIVFFVFIPFNVWWASHMCWFLIFIKHGKFLSVISKKLISVSIWGIKITYILNHLILAHLWKKVSIYFFQYFIYLCFLWMDSVVCLKVHLSFILQCLICH